MLQYSTMQTLLILAVLFQYVLVTPTLPSQSRDWGSAIRRVSHSIVPVISFRLGDDTEEEPVTKATVGSHADIICTAIVIDRNSYLLLTEKHCLADEVEVEFEGMPEARRYAAGELILVQTKGRAKGWESVELRKDTVGLGESVGALGYVMGSQSPLFAPGTITGSLWGGLLTTIPIWPGHSGSPIFDTSGRLVTVVRQTRQPQGYLSPWSFSEAQMNVARFLDEGRAEFRKQDVAQKLRK